MPGYQYGQTNIFEISTASCGLTVEKAEVILTYERRVFLDINNSFPANLTEDDQPLYVPGTTLSGTELAPASMPQQVKVWVKTPGARGNVTFALANVTAYPGLAMNHPITNPDLNPDIDFASATTVKIPSSKLVSATLNVRDYAASGTVRITVPLSTGGTRTFEKQIPLDRNNNKIADAGWRAGGTTINQAILTATADVDDIPAVSGQPTGGVLGDGLTTLEEYRGFIVQGQHVRLDPSKKELFVRMDSILQPLDGFLRNIPLTLLFVTAAEVKGNIPAEINPNRGAITGSLEQRAVRIRQKTGLATYVDQSSRTYTSIETWGHAYYNGDLTDVIEDWKNAVLSTNESLVVDIFTDDIAWGGLYDHQGDGFDDPNKKICGQVPAGQQCDSYPGLFTAALHSTTLA